MDCEHALTLISARLDGELPPDDAQGLEVHLAECPACRAAAEAFRLQDADLRHAFGPRREAAAAVAERVAEELSELKTAPAPAGSPAANTLTPPATLPLRRPRTGLLGVVTGLAAAAAALLAVGIWWFSRPTPAPGPDDHPNAPSNLLVQDGLKPRPKPEAPKVETITVGDQVVTKAGERKRVKLPDGSILFLNQSTTVSLPRWRQVRLDAGEIFVDVFRGGPEGKAGVFTVQTPKREVTATGTRFSVRADDKGTGVLVAQGTVLVSGVNDEVGAGQQVAADANAVSPAPRASHVLDWTRDLMAASETPLVPSGGHSGGELVAVDPYGQESKLTLRKYHVDVHVEDGFARTTIDQTYFNAENFQMEGTFYFPLPPDASLSRLAMYTNGNLMEGGMAERNFARQTYERIRYTQRDPALLEWVDGSTFKMRVFPLEPRQEKRIVLSYTQRLPVLYGRTTYRFPAGHTLATVQGWSFEAFVKGGAKLLANSPSHPGMKAELLGDDLRLTDPPDVERYHADPVSGGPGAACYFLRPRVTRPAKLDRDVVLELTDPNAAVAVAQQTRWSFAEHEGNRYLMLRFRPELPSQPKPQRRDWLFLFEASGSRDPLLARVQIETIRTVLKNANHDDTFAVLTAGTRVHKFRDAAVPVTTENVAAAIDFLEKTHLIGALDLEKALQEAEPFLKGAANPHLVHLGGGVASLGEQRPEALVSRIPPGTRYVGVAVGKRYSQQLMKVAAEKTGGYFTQINPDESVVWRGFDLVATLNTPRLLGITVTVPGVKPEEPRFLTFANGVAQGEELAAVAKLGDDPAKDPKAVVVRGTLDGRPYEQTIPVAGGVGGAGYLPRTWAKLEIDRLLAEDSAAHREAIIKLSKEMYVMTPFTSLLVLESEAMYREFRVDRGRKDHWAMYPCPDRMPVVYEPDPNLPADQRNAPDLGGQKPHANQVMQTVLLRTPTRCLNWPGRPNNNNNNAIVTAGQFYGGAFAVPEADNKDLYLGDLGFDGEEGRDEANNKSFAGDFGGNELGRLRARDEPERLFRNAGMNGRGGATRFRLLRAGGGMSRSELAGRRFKARESLEPGFAERESLDAVRLGLADGVSDLRAIDGTPVLMMDGSVRTFGFSPDGRFLAGRGGRENLRADHFEFAPRERRGIVGGVYFRTELGIPAPLLPESNTPEAAGAAPAEMPALNRPLGEMPPVYFPPPAARVSGILRDDTRGPRYYDRIVFSRNERLFTDLLAFAPGMSSGPADVQAVLEAEAAPRAGLRRGQIDDKARKLIDAARATGWRAVSFPVEGGTPLTILCDGSGRYAYERKLPVGLVERVVCDGETILHLYPELGIGARRTVSRFHRAEFADLCPDVLPPAEDLARGADIRAVDDHTVALVPVRAADAAASGKPRPWVETRLVFAPNGRPAERRWVKMPDAKVLAREVYDEAGPVKLFDADGKERAADKRAAKPAEQPDLKPDVSQLVVLPLPLRSRDQVYRSLWMEPNRSLFDGENACFEYLPPVEALKLFAAEVASNNGSNAATVWDSCFRDKGDQRIGFLVLLESSGIPVCEYYLTREVLAEKPNTPLAAYLKLLHGSFPYYQQQLGLLPGPDAEKPDFLGRLTAFRMLAWRWQASAATERHFGYRPEERERALGFVRRNADNAWGWSVLTLLQDSAGPDHDFHKAIAAAWGQVAEKSGATYPARYEQARELLRAGETKEARKRFQELFLTTLEGGVLPAVDSDFRSALGGAEADDAWPSLMREAARKCIAARGRPVVVALAWQSHQLGDQPLADTLLALAMEGISDKAERIQTTLAAIEYLWGTSQPAQADALVQRLLEDSDLAKSPLLWRLASHVAERRGQTVRSIACLEKALDLEFAHLPEVVNLEAVRTDYRKLLDHYQWLANASATLKVAAPADLAARTVKAADRWRSLDQEGSEPCDKAATVLRTLGDPRASELAWDYMTTPLALKPNESGGWLSLASVLTRDDDRALADRCYEAAFNAEPTNAQILWDRAQNLQRQGQVAEGRKLLRQVADGDWQPRFNWLKREAKAIVGEK